MTANHRYEGPRGKRSRALEQNIVRYRALEMVLVLYYTENLRNLIIGTIQATDRVRSALNDKVDLNERIPARTKRPLQKALNILLADQIVTEAEKIEIEKLVRYRNDIAHRLAQLNIDIGQTALERDFIRFRQSGSPRYDYGALERLRSYRKLLIERMSGTYVFTVSLEPLLFESTEKALTLGLQRIRRTIDRQFEA